jgi:hypothetical protein
MLSPPAHANARRNITLLLRSHSMLASPPGSHRLQYIPRSSCQLHLPAQDLISASDGDAGNPKRMSFTPMQRCLAASQQRSACGQRLAYLKRAVRSAAHYFGRRGARGAGRVGQDRLAAGGRRLLACGRRRWLNGLHDCSTSCLPYYGPGGGTSVTLTMCSLVAIGTGGIQQVHRKAHTSPTASPVTESTPSGLHPSRQLPQVCIRGDFQVMGTMQLAMQR